jgi:hypothetical protein
VRHTSAATKVETTWDFRTLPLARPIVQHFARCFGVMAGPTGTYRSTNTVDRAYALLRRFAVFLSTLDPPPTRPQDLRPGHLMEFRLQVLSDPRKVGQLKRILFAHNDPYTDAFRAALVSSHGKRPRVKQRESYTDEEFRLLLTAAREDVRAARARIRRNLAHLDRWRRGGITEANDPVGWGLGQILDQIAREGDVPRWQSSSKNRGGINYDLLARHGLLEAAVNALYLTKVEVAAFAVLLVALTGQNFSTLAEAPAAHHVTGDPHGQGTLLVELLKPRRGKYRAHMTVPLQTTIPSWVPLPEGGFTPGRKELLSGLGVYLLLLDLTQPARTLAGSDRLFGWFAQRGRGTEGRGVKVGAPEDASEWWSDVKALKTADGKPLRLEYGRLRLTHLQHRNEPVAQTRATLHRDYLIKDGRDLVRYQRVVATTLAERIAAAQEAMRLTYLTAADLVEARRNPALIADRLGVSVATLKRLLEGRLDTVLAACRDNHNGPYTPGRACQASFLLCTECPCAVALPRHLVVQVAAHDALLERRADTTPLDWVERFGAAWARLADILGNHPQAAIGTARDQIDDDTRRLVERLLNRELDA